MAITIHEIAQKANVSTATVSMVLNNKPGISPATREKVFKIVEEFGYSLSPLKKVNPRNRGNLQLAIYKKHAKVVGDTPFFQALIEGIESKARKNSFQLMIKYMSDKTNMDDVIASIRENTIDGVLLLGTEMTAEDFKRFAPIDIPVLLVDSFFPGVPSNYLVIDNISGVFTATKHLLEKGHRKIGYLKSSIIIQNFKERYDGYAMALAEAGIKPDPAYTVPLMPTMEGAYADMLKALQKPHLPTAYIADNDIIAFGAIKALKENNIRIPEDVSIIGFDDMPFCTMIEPQLTTINVDKNALGQLAVENLIHMIEWKKKIFFKTSLGVTLVQRGSVKSVK